MAGLRESCAHIGALLFKIETAVRAGFTRRACTDEACLWNDDFKENVTPAELCNINLYSAKSIENFKGKQSNNSFPDTAIKPTQNEIDSFIQSFHNKREINQLYYMHILNIMKITSPSTSHQLGQNYPSHCEIGIHPQTEKRQIKKYLPYPTKFWNHQQYLMKPTIICRR